jgi:hypothetical protein
MLALFTEYLGSILASGYKQLEGANLYRINRTKLIRSKTWYIGIPYELTGLL